MYQYTNLYPYAYTRLKYGVTCFQALAVSSAALPLPGHGVRGEGITLYPNNCYNFYPYP